jgi:hypothetical protein
MPEATPYFDSITASRALLLDEEEALQGGTTISLETCQDLAEEDILTYITDNFSVFMHHLRFLRSEDQELLLSYYLLSKTQNALAIIHKSTQTVCSFRIRMAAKQLASVIMNSGEPSTEKLHEVFERTGLENSLGEGAPLLSDIVSLYAKLRSFQRIAEMYKLHRPDIRRAMSRASKQLIDSKDPEENAVVAYLHGLIDKANPSGVGYSKRKAAKLGHLYRVDPDLLGEFRLRIEDENFGAMFVSRANR